jgi:hypothetical protein
MNEWLTVAPQAQLAHGHTGCMTSLNDMADRAPRPLADGETIEIGRAAASAISIPRIPRMDGTPA